MIKKGICVYFRRALGSPRAVIFQYLSVETPYKLAGDCTQLLLMEHNLVPRLFSHKFGSTERRAGGAH
jgi:hypothetical protein